jgi:hypothetical protein
MKPFILRTVVDDTFDEVPPAFLTRRQLVDLFLLADVHADDCQTRATAFPQHRAFYEARRDEARELSDAINEGLS